MIVLKIVKWIIAWEKKKDFADLQVFLLPANFESDGMMSHKHGPAAKTVSK